MVGTETLCVLRGEYMVGVLRRELQRGIRELATTLERLGVED